MSYVDVGAVPALSTSRSQPTFGPSAGPVLTLPGSRTSRTAQPSRGSRRRATGGKKASPPSPPRGARSRGKKARSGGLLSWLFGPKVAPRKTGGTAQVNTRGTSSTITFPGSTTAPTPSRTMEEIVVPGSGGSGGGAPPVIDPGTGSEAYLPEVGPEPVPTADGGSWKKWAVVGACAVAAVVAVKKMRS